MRKIKNPYIGLEGYHCFGCAPHNESGLRMEFFEDDGDVVSVWDPEPQFRGYMETLHGGVQASLMDELAGWVVMIQAGTGGVTSKMDIRFKKPVRTDVGKITLRGRPREMKRNIAVIDTEILLPTGETASSGEFFYYTYPPEVAKEKLHFPGVEAFFER